MATVAVAIVFSSGVTYLLSVENDKFAEISNCNGVAIAVAEDRFGWKWSIL